MKILLVVLALVSVSLCQNGCTYTDQNGVSYNFSALRSDTTDYLIKVNYFGSNWNFWLNICGPIISALCGQGVSTCFQWDPSTPAGKASLGMASTQTFGGENGKIIASFSNGGGGRSETITFLCNSTAGVGHPSYLNESKLHYNFVWPTAAACACGQADDCYECAEEGCKWCLDTDSCIGINDDTCMSFITKPNYCPGADCSPYTTCDDCLQFNAICDWCLDSESCIDIEYANSCGDVLNNPSFCPSNVFFN